MEETIRDMLTVTEVFKSGKYSEKEESEVPAIYISVITFISWLNLRASHWHDYSSCLKELSYTRFFK